jgi:hypothetical protein
LPPLMHSLHTGCQCNTTKIAPPNLVMWDTPARPAAVAAAAAVGLQSPCTNSQQVVAVVALQVACKHISFSCLLCVLWCCHPCRSTHGHAVKAPLLCCLLVVVAAVWCESVCVGGESVVERGCMACVGEERWCLVVACVSCRGLLCPHTQRAGCSSS